MQAYINRIMGCMSGLNIQRKSRLTAMKDRLLRVLPIRFVCEPGISLFVVPVPLWNKDVGVIKCADMYRNFFFTFPGQRGSALVTKTTPHPRRRIVNTSGTLTEMNLVGLEYCQGGNCGTGVSSAAITMTMADKHRLPNCVITHRTAHTATAYLLIANH